MSGGVEALRLFARYDEGQGPLVVLLHGINADARDWRPVMDRMGEGYRIIAFDVLGFGESPKPSDIDYTADEHALVLENTLRDMGAHEPFLLVGYSLGGDIAVRYASTYPHRLRRLFLLSAPFYLPPEAMSKAGFGQDFLHAAIFEKLWKLLARSQRDDNAIYQLVTGRLEDFAKGFMRTGDVPAHWDVMSKNLVNCISAATFVDDLPRLSMPTVFALGIRDPIVQPDQTPALKRLKPDIEIRRIVGLTADHFLLVNIPERIADEIMRDEVRSLNVAWRGGKGQPLLLLHGIESSSEQWMPAAKALALHNDVAVVDLLGFGSSPAPMSLHYTMADHVAALAKTASALWGSAPSVRIAGEGLGGLIALGAAAAFPDNVTQVVAFAPPLLVPGARLGADIQDEGLGQTMAAREALAQYAGDERAQAVTSDEVEARIVPAARSLENTVLATDADELLARVVAAARIVMPAQMAPVLRAYVESQAQARANVELAIVQGGDASALDDPAAVVRAIDPDRADEAKASKDKAPVKPKKGATLVDFVRGVDNALARRAILSMAAGLALLVVHPIPARLVTTGFAIWVFVSAVNTILGAVGLRRQRKSGWLAWVLIGGVGLGVGAFMVLRIDFAIGVVHLYVAGYAGYLGLADLYVAARAKETAKARWLLYAEGAVGVVTALAVFFAPDHGAPLVQLALIVYFLATGGSLLLYVVAVKRQARARVRELLGVAASPRTA